MMWNTSNLRYDEDPKMVACGLVDHNGGKFPGDTAVNLDFPTPPMNQDGFDFPPPAYEPYTPMHAEAEGMDERKIEWEHDCNSKNSSASDISRVMWNISNLPDDADPKMEACGLVDHNGGKFPGDTAVNLDFSTSPMNQDGFDFPPPAYEPCTPMHAEAEGMAERKIEWEHDCNSKNSSASDISRVMWNISNLPDDADPKMVACGLVDHNGGKFPGDTAVNLDFSTSPMNQDGFYFPPPAYEPRTPMHAEAEGMAERKIEWEHDCTSKNSSASDISRVMWNISNLPDDADPKMVACGLVDHNGGKLAVGDTGVSLTIPPQAIPEGRTEGIFIAIMNQEKENPKVTSKEPLLSPVVTCGPNGLVFDRHVILSLPHCALLGDGSWNLKGGENCDTLENARKFCS